MVEQMESERDNLATEPLNLNRKHVTVLVRTEKGGEMRLEDGDSGRFVLFDGDCLDMLPLCHAQCCALQGTMVNEESQERLVERYGEEAAEVLLDFHQHRVGIVMRRCADGRCIALNRDTFKCDIYENRPDTCKDFHCTRGSGMRGFPLGNSVVRQWSP